MRLDKIWVILSSDVAETVDRFVKAESEGARSLALPPGIADQLTATQTKAVLAVDGGASKTKIHIIAADGETIAQDFPHCANPVASTWTKALVSIIFVLGYVRPDLQITKAWFGISGLDSTATISKMRAILAELLSVPVSCPDLFVTNDTALLGTTIHTAFAGETAKPLHDEIVDRTGAAPQVKHAIALIAGTGSNACALSTVPPQGDRGRTPLPSGLYEIGQTGGHGHLFGDEGSGWWIGREAIRATLAEVEVHAAARPPAPPFSLTAQLVLNAYGTFKEPSKLIDCIYDFEDTKAVKAAAAALCKPILAIWSRCPVAIRIAESAAGHLANSGYKLMLRHKLNPTNTLICGAGGLWLCNDFVHLVTYKFAEREELQPMSITVAHDPAEEAAQHLARKHLPARALPPDLRRR
ncbi:uncharacterized protein L969DRAFT_84699 [Mixia osmundae IAM 14324]|uniref:N-acetyl-D-glucosamine kinase n=1 Tax=Mixia osmundae (strain CBS 9802 / IAM 14324 / JCM 22182 / KY 12970) TaxID=764103 RepID=G7DTK2_MIXOS|nr:uncharacterized protein L969DRAFT_84699 [Mixia osmundae IAM 14324]KEI42814.1 hypothetical protein L969DRAFT_84699 [Mixia osmundae IAM 14324]GAA93849.1 hypothetical protein E5Q_00495 [Mixia osmundae IAM 14324]